MRSRRLISFLLALFVMFAAIPGNMALAFDAGDAAGSHALASCHEAMAADADALPHDHDAPADVPQVWHGCCVSFVGIVSLAEFSLPGAGARETIAFSPSLRLASRVTGIYHPPRQNA
ncbi:MAG: hypothetical protein LBP86_04585 [Azoarcus sp.]|jgi:hypothetical protein|nr:hypothetical protein [Azoarcus sp.]